MQSNPCIRCDKERIKGKEKKVIMNSTATLITTYVCPDKDCQKMVEEEIAEREARKLDFIHPKVSLEKSKNTLYLR